MTRRCLAAAALLVFLASSDARADDAAATLRDASSALDTGEYQRAADLVRPLVDVADRVEEIDRAEAYRLYGLAMFFLDRLGQAEGALLAYLRLDPDAHLDPGRYPPEAIVFFEDIRARHKAELRGMHERPRNVSEWSKNLFPPWGQFANGHNAKGWLIAGLEVGLLAAHLSTFFILDRWCDAGRTGVCRSGDEDQRSTAQALQAINLAAGAGVIAVYAWGVIDGFYHHRRRRMTESPPHMSVGVSPTSGGAAASFTLRF